MTSTVQKDEAPVLPDPNDLVFSSRVSTPKKNLRRQRRRPFTKGHSDKSILPAESKKQLLDSAHLSSPLRLSFPIFVSFRGLLHLCNSLHSCLKIRDRQMQAISACDLFYSALLYSILKVMRCDASDGYVDPDLSTFELTLKDVLFPSIIADYIDSIGKFTLSNGLTIAPSFRWITWNSDGFSTTFTYIRKHFVHPALCFEDSTLPEWYKCATADMDIPYAEIGHVSSVRWCLTPDVISRYRRLIPRLTKSVDMRSPVPTAEGQMNICVCRKTFQGDFVTGYAPQIVPDEVARIGAVFGWNEFECYTGWPENREMLIPKTFGVMFSLSEAVAQMVQTKMKLFQTV